MAAVLVVYIGHNNSLPGRRDSVIRACYVLLSCNACKRDILKQKNGKMSNAVDEMDDARHRDYV